MTGPDSAGGPARGPGALMADVLAGIARLVRGEIALARAEAGLRLHAARQAIVQAIIAVVLGLTALNVLAAAAVAAVIALGLKPAWAALVVGGVLLLLALVLAQRASRLIRTVGTAPSRAADNVRRDMETLQTMVKPDAAV
jgi:Putative Actinobacterial Holin-X, holin superfamily III